MLKSTLRFHSDRDRGRQDGSGGGAVPAADREIGTYLDTLDLSHAIISDEMVLQEAAGKEFVLHEVVDCRARKVGSFKGAVDIWVAIDEIDDARAGRHASA